MPFFKTHRGLNWHAEIDGKGEAVVCIHGFGASGRWWQAQKDFLHSDYQVMTLDLPGHGQSSWMELTLTEMADDIRQILNSIGLSKISLVASSLGGLVALELYRMMPECILRMSLTGSIPKFVRTDNYPAGLDIDKIRTLSGQFDGNYASILDIFFRSLFTMQERQSDRFKWIRDIYRKGPLPQREALKHFLNILEKADLRDYVSSIVCPVQFITGTEDYICPRSIMDWVKGRMPNVRLDLIDGCGHLPFLVKAQEYNRLLGYFLEEQTCKTH